MNQNFDWSVTEKMLSKIEIIPESGCWVWMGATNLRGYGQVKRGFRGKKKIKGVHRIFYEHYVGPIPEGLEIDHLCRERTCVFPKHLKAVDHDENIRRGTHNNQYKNASHCIYGHPFSGENLYIQPNGERTCRICRKRISSEYDQRVKKGKEQ